MTVVCPVTRTEYESFEEYRTAAIHSINNILSSIVNSEDKLEIAKHQAEYFSHKAETEQAILQAYGGSFFGRRKAKDAEKRFIEYREKAREAKAYVKEYKESLKAYEENLDKYWESIPGLTYDEIKNQSNAARM